MNAATQTAPAKYPRFTRICSMSDLALEREEAEIERNNALGMTSGPGGWDDPASYSDYQGPGDSFEAWVNGMDSEAAKAQQVPVLQVPALPW